MAIGKFRCVVMNVTDLERGERFWTEVTGLNVQFSAVGHPTPYSRLGDIKSHSILLQLAPEEHPLHPNNGHVDITVESVDVAVEQALALGATLIREKGTYPLDSTKPYLEWAVMDDPFGNTFCLIKDLVYLNT